MLDGCALVFAIEKLKPGKSAESAALQMSIKQRASSGLVGQYESSAVPPLKNKARVTTEEISCLFKPGKGDFLPECRSQASKLFRTLPKVKRATLRNT